VLVGYWLGRRLGRFCFAKGKPTDMVSVTVNEFTSFLTFSEDGDHRLFEASINPADLFICDRCESSFAKGA
jgi:hypothetical protein